MSTQDTPAPAAFPPHRVTYALAKLGFRILLHALTPRLIITGRHRVPHRGGVIFTPNHISHLDSALLAGLVRRPLRFMAMQDMFEMRGLGAFVKFFGAFPIQRDSADRSALNYAAQVLKAGSPLVVYPEGRLSESGELGPILPGAVLLALRAGVPIIPVGISGTQHVMPYGLTIPRPTLERVHLHLGEPLQLGDLKGLPRRDQREIATRRMEEAILEAREIARSGA